MAFRGWNEAAVVFFEGLEVDNSKEYWHANKSTYDEHVRRPMEELLAELEREFGEGKIFRPNRDIRFSLDKSPYKTTIAGTLSKGGYISFSAEGLGVGTGLYMPMPDQLDRLRRAVADDKTGGQLEKLVATLHRDGIEVSAHDELKTAPRGYPKDHPRIDLLRLKGLTVWRSWPIAGWIGTAKAKDRIVDVLHAAKPVTAWLDKHVGPSVAPTERGR